MVYSFSKAITCCSFANICNIQSYGTAPALFFCYFVKAVDMPHTVALISLVCFYVWYVRVRLHIPSFRFFALYGRLM
ncbi:MAG: hypothetical protein EXX96DRAFT_553376 [Benjaminiella poitrasii]|nr:MAG: hypothetical protein EXX96DRAFT_553376 [Benjaminiella poitrasii]